MFDRLKKLQPDFKRLSHYWQQAREKLAEQHYLTGIRHFKEQQLKEAIQEWDQALALNPNLENAKRSRERATRLLKNLETIQ
jgi:tetratricopeptide (TPR) repeat protein